MTIIVFLLGLIIGSFLNVCIYRLPSGQSVVMPPSHCMQCGARLGWQDLIPVVSYLFLRGRCRKCKTKYSARYAVVELLTGLLFVWCLMVMGLSVFLVKALVLTAFLIVITFIDYDHQLILDKVLVCFAAAGVIINFILYDISILDMLFGALAGGGLLLFIAVVSRGGMGGGDIKFASALGLWVGLKVTLLCLFISFILGGIGGGFFMFCGLKGRKDFIPFGPFIAIALFLSLLYGQEILVWYYAWILG